MTLIQKHIYIFLIIFIIMISYNLAAQPLKTRLAISNFTDGKIITTESAEYKKMLVAHLNASASFETISETTESSSNTDVIVTGKITRITEQANDDDYDMISNPSKNSYWIELTIVDVNNPSNNQTLKDKVETAKIFDDSAKAMAKTISRLFSEKKIKQPEPQTDQKKEQNKFSDMSLWAAPSALSGIGNYRTITKNAAGISIGLQKQFNEYSFITSTEYMSAQPGADTLSRVSIFSIFGGVGYNLKFNSLKIIPCIQGGVLFHSIKRSSTAPKTEYNGLYWNPALQTGLIAEYFLTEKIGIMLSPYAGTYFGGSNAGTYTKVSLGVSYNL